VQLVLFRCHWWMTGGGFGCYLQPEVNLMPNFTCHPRCSSTTYANPKDPKDQDVLSRGRVLRGVEP